MWVVVLGGSLFPLQAGDQHLMGSEHRAGNTAAIVCMSMFRFIYL